MKDLIKSDAELFSSSTVNVELPPLLIENIINPSVTDGVLNQDIAWYDTNQVGDFASRVADDLRKVEEGIGEKASIALYFVIVCVCCVTQALILGWQLALVCMISLPLVIFTMTFISSISAKFALSETNAYGKAGEIAEEVFTALKTVVAFGGQRTEGDRYNKHLLFACNNNIKRALFNGVGEGLTWFFMFSSYAIGFWYGIHLIVRDYWLPSNLVTYDAGTLISIFFSIFSACWYFSSILPYLEVFGIAKGASVKIFCVIASEPKINASKDSGIKYTKVKGKITFEDVHFNYPSRSSVKILNGLDFTINPGEKVALVGSSGCGKSTCMQLIQRFYDPDAGSVYIDDYDLKWLDLSWIRSYIGVVSQEPILFETTVAENIRLGCPNASLEDVRQAAEKANAHSFIKELPLGYNTLVGERGTQLSGGQKQRIAIARALVRKPSILLLDEATSALDANSEATVQAALDIVSSTECTTVIVAHRLSTVRKADRIIVISDGRVKEQGNHDYLMSVKGAYYELITSQVSEDQVRIEPRDVITEISRHDSIDESVKKTHLEDVSQKNGKPESAWAVMRFSAPEWWAVLIACIASVVNGAGMPLFSVVYGKIMGVLANVGDVYLEHKASTYSYSFIGLGFGLGLTSFLQTYFFSFSGEKLTMRLRSQLFMTFLSQEVGYFDDEDNSVGALCGILSSEAASVQGATGQRIGNILSSLSTVVIALMVAFLAQWRIALVALCFAPVIIFFVYFEKKMLFKESQSSFKALQSSTKIAVEAINGIRTVASLCSESTFHSLYMAEVVPYQIMAQCNAHFRGVVYGISRSLMLFAYAACFYYGATLVKNKNEDYSHIYTVTMCIMTGSWSIAKGFAFTPNLQRGLIAASRINAKLKREPLIRDGSDNGDEKWSEGIIEYRNVQFSYPSRRTVKVLKGFNLSILPNKTTALVGASGCGKSTIVQLLERFYDHDSGIISVDNKAINTMKLSTLRSQLGIVSQEPNLFSKTIADNIAYGDHSRCLSETEIIQAAKCANIHDFITSLPLGYNTELGEKGTQLSGGQKQRIAIARALIRNPKILLLDEATSALDAESEKVVQEALDKARRGRTCIIIAHRLSTVQDSDVICVIDQGRVAEMGTHQELLRLKGIYYNLY
ncbi:hypothetical protein FQA39_LY12502 [Lamprigera yunnana]|nr:hypothetical protein FQA39_LY12502 [Lamprigera yunnana]